MANDANPAFDLAARSLNDSIRVDLKGGIGRQFPRREAPEGWVKRSTGRAPEKSGSDFSISGPRSQAGGACASKKRRRSSLRRRQYCVHRRVAEASLNFGSYFREAFPERSPTTMGLSILPRNQLTTLGQTVATTFSCGGRSRAK